MIIICSFIKIESADYKYMSYYDILEKIETYKVIYPHLLKVQYMENGKILEIPKINCGNRM